MELPLLILSLTHLEVKSTPFAVLQIKRLRKVFPFLLSMDSANFWATGVLLF